MNQKLSFYIDRGGTFTDVFVEYPDGTTKVFKLLSQNPSEYKDAPREAIRRSLEEYLNIQIPPDKIPSKHIATIRMGTTVSTNALLEKKGVRTALFITKGFRDLLKIGDQSRPDIFALRIEKPEVLYDVVDEIDERVKVFSKFEDEEKFLAREIQVLTKPDLTIVRKQLEEIYRQGVESIAIVCMHSYVFPNHELAIGEVAETVGFKEIALSHQVASTNKFLHRANTAVLESYLNPVLKQYIENFVEAFDEDFSEVDLFFMQSNGGLITKDTFSSKNSLLSGPAGGIVGYSEIFYQINDQSPLIGFDMGGTSTDVSRFNGEYEISYESEIAKIPIQTPQLSIETVAAGGGSRLFFENGMLKVGPESSGSEPGPICYRKNGFLSVTDANLALGRLQKKLFPAIFGKNHNQELDASSSISALKEITSEINSSYAKENLPPKTWEQVAEGFLEVANENMMSPIKKISTAKGLSLEEHALVCFGGAGGQHACSIARKLGISKIFIHQNSGILSAVGMKLAKQKMEKSVIISNELTKESIKDAIALSESLRSEMLREYSLDKSKVNFTTKLILAYEGQENSFLFHLDSFENLKLSFTARYKREFGFHYPEKRIWIKDAIVQAKDSGKSSPYKTKSSKPKEVEKIGEFDVFLDGKWSKTLFFQWDYENTTSQIDGPAVVVTQSSTILLERNAKAFFKEGGILEIQLKKEGRDKAFLEKDPVQLAIFGNQCMSIAEQMGEQLKRTAISTNIKERQDYSCAIFDRDGGLVANAPHQPVHLGSMGHVIKFLNRKFASKIDEGDVFISNHPQEGGSHLPDITISTPFLKNGKILFWVASRGHHADIGGISPGSMPPFSKILSEEGVAIFSQKIIESSNFKDRNLENLFAGSHLKYPSRSFEDNLADLKAQIAANQKGISLIEEMLEKRGEPYLKKYMLYLQDIAENSVRDLLIKFSKENQLEPNSPLKSVEYMDDGSCLVLNLTIDTEEGSATFDFSDSSSQVWGNTNTPESVTYSAIIYSLRCLIDLEVPLNEGCLKPIKVIFGDNSILSPSPTAAVVGGNVLTSQRLVDLILKPFNRVAASQGCMNNFTFGDDRFGYYETIAGGTGAGIDFEGTDAIHSHMTNTKITDPEILEIRYPALLREFSIRKDSGGIGKYKGGNGINRKFEFLKNLNVGILSERRVFSPYGLKGGGDGKIGANTLITSNDQRFNLGSKNSLRANKGDQILISTPGGGGAL